MTDTDGTHKIAELVDHAEIAMFTTMTTDGRHVSRPMAVQEAPYDGNLWFFVYDDSDTVAQIGQHPQVNVSFADQNKNQWTSIAGTATSVHDRAKAEELWSAPLKAWFPDGLDTKGLGLIKVDAESAEYWDGPSSKVVQLIGMARAAVTGNPDKFPGENKAIDL